MNFRAFQKKHTHKSLGISHGPKRLWIFHCCNDQTILESLNLEELQFSAQFHEMPDHTKIRKNILKEQRIHKINRLINKRKLKQEALKNITWLNSTLDD